MKYDLVAVGGLVEDVVLRTDEAVLVDNPGDILRQKLLAFEYGAKINIHETSMFFGGGAANVSTVAAKLGLRSAVIGAVGDDARGQSILCNLRKHKIDVGSVRVIKGDFSGFSVLVVGPGGEHILFPVRGANEKISIGANEEHLLTQTELAYVSSLPRANWSKLVTRALRKVKRVAWNPGQNQLLEGWESLSAFLTRCFLVILNKDEATQLLLSHPSYLSHPDLIPTDAGELAKALANEGIRTLAVTDGAAGAYLSINGALHFRPAARFGEALDTTGVGDAFGSTLASSLLMCAKDPARALSMAMVNAASVVAIPGAQNGQLNKAKLMTRLKEYEKSL